MTTDDIMCSLVQFSFPSSLRLSQLMYYSECFFSDIEFSVFRQR